MDEEDCTDGDGLPPDFKPSENFPALRTYLKTLPYEKVRSSLFTAVKTMESDSVTSIGVIGACWGGSFDIFSIDKLIPTTYSSKPNISIF